MSHLFGGTGLLGLGHGGWVKAVEDIAPIAATAFLGPEVGALLGPALGVGTEAATSIGEGLVGAAGGAVSSGLQGGNPLLGAALGGAGGAVAPFIGDIAGDVSGALGIGSGAAGDVASSAASSDASAVASDLSTTPVNVGGVSAASVTPPLGTDLLPSDATNLASSVDASLGGTNSVGLATTAPSAITGPLPDGSASAIQNGGLPGLASAGDASTALGTSSYFPNAPTADPISNVTPAGSALPTGFLGTSGGGGNPELAGLSGVADPTGVASVAGNTPQASMLSKIGSALGINSIGDAATKAISGAGISGIGKLLGVGAAGAALTKDLSTGNSIPGISNVSALAGQAQTQGSVLQGYLTSGTLPPAVQASVDQATKDGITAIKAKFASMGVAPGSTQETSAIAQLQQNAVIQGATLADQLLQQGISESTLAGTLYNELVGTNVKLNDQTGAAISNLASALAGGGTKIQIGGTVAA